MSNIEFNHYLQLNLATCFGGLATQCLTCETGYVLEGNECKSSCSTGLY